MNKYPNNGNNIIKGMVLFMKKYFVLISLIIIFICLLSKDSQMRIRVIANSDEVNDQILKKEIVHQLQKQTLDLNNLDIIKEQVSYIVKSNNYNYTVDVKIQTQKFDTKYYEDQIIKGGKYKTLVITLGKGEGANYWSLLYPEYYGVGFEEVNTGNVTYSFWLLEKFKSFF